MIAWMLQRQIAGGLKTKDICISVSQGSGVTYQQLPEEQIFYIYALVVLLVVIIELPILLVMSPIT